MRILTIFLFCSFPLIGGELRVTLPNDEFGAAVVESLSEKTNIVTPEPQIKQKGQVAILEFKNLKAGKYRVSYISVLDPLAYLTTIMETHVEVTEKRKESVLLFRPWQSDGSKLPKEVKDFLMDHRENFLSLSVVYDGSKQTFDLTRGRLCDIGVLRSDCEYHIAVWNHSFREFPKDRKVIFERRFRASVTDADPFAANDAPQKTEETQVQERSATDEE